MRLSETGEHELATSEAGILTHDNVTIHLRLAQPAFSCDRIIGYSG